MKFDGKHAAAMISAGALVAGSVIVIAIWGASIAAERITDDHKEYGTVKDHGTSAPVITELPSPVIDAATALPMPVEIAESEDFGTDQPGLITLVPCATEDSDNCYWHAPTMGNHTGASFVVIDGVTYWED